MDAASARRARARAYDLLGGLYLEGLTPAVWTAVRAVPAFAAVLPSTLDADEAAADHYRLFHLDVPPYAGVLLDAEGRLGGPATQAAAQHYAEAGWAPATTAESPDHLGHALGFLAACGPEAARRFMDEHLLWWLPAVVLAVRQEGHPFYDAVAGLTLELVLDHRTALGPTPPPAPPDAPAPPADLLDRPETGLGDVARHLATPARSGLYLGRSAVARLARSAGVPRGFGGRALLLANVLRAAADLGRMDVLLEELTRVLDAWRAHYEALREPLPGVAAWWLERLTATQAMVPRLRAAVDDG